LIYPYMLASKDTANILIHSIKDILIDLINKRFDTIVITMC
jgi:hypothetical protein